MNIEKSTSYVKKKPLRLTMQGLKKTALKVLKKYKSRSGLKKKLNG